MPLNQAIPILRVFDRDLARSFYVDWLRFRVDWEHRFDEASPRYTQVSRDNVVLHLTEHYGDCTPGARVFIRTSDVEGLHRELHARPNPNMAPGICVTPWNSKCVEVVDPFGNRLTFDEPMANSE